MRTTVLFFSIFIHYINAYSQNFQLIKSVTIDEPSEVSIDRAGNIYFSTFMGDIIRYNATLEDRFIFSPSNPNTTTILEAWQGLRIFSFHKDLQLYRLINRNLSLNEDYRFPTNLVGFAEIATSSYDNNVWVIDQIDFSLKKFEIFSNSISSMTTLGLILNPDNYEILHCKEYQNRLFISTRENGILIFDNFGSYLKTYQNNGISSFNFWEDYLYFLNEDSIVKLNLYKDETLQLKLPEPSNWLFIIIFEDRTYLFSTNQLAFYE